jgi:hypothetical protein
MGFLIGLAARLGLYRAPTVFSIVKGLAKIQRQLDRHAAQKQAQYDHLTDLIERVGNARHHASEEAGRAIRIKGKLAELLA